MRPASRLTRRSRERRHPNENAVGGADAAGRSTAHRLGTGLPRGRPRAASAAEGLSAQRVLAPIVKRRTNQVGLDRARLAGRMLRDGRATSAAADGASERVIIRRRRIRGAYSGVVMNWHRSDTARFTWTSAWWRAARATPRPGPRGRLRSETLAMSALDEARARGEARLDGLERRHDSRRSLCWPRHTRQHGARQAGQ